MDTVEHSTDLIDDLSRDAQGALIDAALWLYRGFFIPGDHLLSLLSAHAPRVAASIAIDAASYGGMLSGFVSAVVWLGAIIVIVVVYKLIRALDRALTAFVWRLFEELRRTARVVTRRLGIAFRSYALERQARLARTEVSERPMLTALELAVLRSHAKLPPGHLVTPSQIASAIDMRSADVEQALAALRKLSLIERTFGAGDGEDGYRLTRAGQVFLVACSRTQPTKRQEPRVSEVSLGAWQ
jgi:DNA-binding MarR family transcriptional regulator